MEKSLIYNAIQTPDGTILHSKHRHDYVSHLDTNGEVYVNDGGNDYIRRSVNIIEALDISLYDDAPFEVIREYITRGGRGKNMDEPLKYVLLKDIDDEWLQAIIDYEELYRLCNTQLNYYRQEQEYRNNKL